MPSGRAIEVPPGGNLQAALDAAQPGDVIELTAGATYVGNVVLPRKDGTQWIVIRSSAHTRLPPSGDRVSPAHAQLMPKLVSPNRDPAIRTAAGAHHFRFVGIEVTTTSPFSFGLVRLESPAQRSSSLVPTDIVFERCYIHGTPSGEIRRGIALNGARVAIIDSYLSDFHERRADSQAILGWSGPGPFKIVNNYLEASGVNLMFGGGDPIIGQLVPSDIVIRGNYFSKPLSWKVGHPSYAGRRWSVKNLFELKNARRVLVDGNIFENNWTGADQGGFAIVFTPRNQDGGAPWSVVSDVTFTRNIIRRSTAGVYILGWDNLRSSRQLERILIQNNLFVDLGAFPDTVYAGYFTGMLFMVSDGPRDLVIDHNTAFQTAHPVYAQTHVARRWPAIGFVFTNNITQHNQGIRGDGTDTPLKTLAAYFQGAAFARNALPGGQAANYPPDNFFPASLDLVGFVSLAGADYRLRASSRYKHVGTDGKDLGADVTAIDVLTVRRGESSRRP
jgi:hypothetical protein